MRSSMLEVANSGGTAWSTSRSCGVKTAHTASMDRHAPSITLSNIMSHETCRRFHGVICQAACIVAALTSANPACWTKCCVW